MNLTLKLLAIILLTLSSAIAQDTNPEIDVMSFNIRYGTANDGDNHWNLRSAQLLELLKSSSPDILGLQEVLKFQLDEIMATLPDYAMIGVSREGNWQDEFSAILYRSDTFSPKKTNTYWLSDTPEIPSKGWGNEIMRIVTWAEFKHIKSDRSFYIYNAHFDHRSQPSREKGVDQLVNIIKMRDHNYPVIITGDFNAGEDNRAIINLKNNGFDDAYRVLNPNETTVGTFNGFNGTNDGDKIDYVFVGQSLQVLEASIDRSNSDGKYPSDHYPVTAKVKLLD